MRETLRVAHNFSKAQDNKMTARDRQKFERRLKLAMPTRHTSYMKNANIPGVTAYWIFPPGIQPRRTIVYLHGGGFINGSTRAYLQHIIRIAKLCEARVLSIDYRLAPEHPYPSALDDILNAWQHLMRTDTLLSEPVTFMGESAGGSLALAAALRVRDEGLDLPSGVVLLSPALDISMSGKSITTREKREVILSRQKINMYADLYAGDASRIEPYISPVVADLHGLPPLLIHVGTEEMLYSDSVLIAEHAKRDGVPCELYIGEGMWHSWHVAAGIIPEAKRDIQAVAQFIKERIK